MFRRCTTDRFSRIARAVMACAVLLCGSAAWGTDYYWKTAVTSGNWTDFANWETGSSGSGTNSTSFYPSSNSDNAIFKSSPTVTVTGDVSVDTLMLDAAFTHTVDVALTLIGGGSITAESFDFPVTGTYSTTINSGTTLTITKTLFGNMDSGSMTFTNNGTLYIPASGANVNWGTSKITYSGTSPIPYGDPSTYTVLASGMSKFPSSDVTITASTTSTVGSADINFAYSVAITGTETYTLGGTSISNGNTGNLTISGSTHASSSSVLKCTSGSIASGNGITITIKTPDGSMTLATIKYTQGVISWTGSSSSEWANYENWTGLTSSFDFTTGLSGKDVTIYSGVTNYPSITTTTKVKSLSIDTNAHVAVESGGTVQTGSITCSGNSYIKATAGTVEFYTDGTWSASYPEKTTFYNILIDSGCTLTPSSNMYVSGSWTNSGTFTHNSKTVYFTGTGTVNNSTSSFYNVTVNASGKTVTLGADTAVAGALTVTSGTLAAGTHALTVTGATANRGTISADSGTMTFNGAVTNNGTLSVTTGKITLGGAYTGSSDTITIGGGTLDASSAYAKTVNTLSVTTSAALTGGTSSSYALTVTTASFTSNPAITTTGFVTLPACTTGALTASTGTLTTTGAVSASSVTVASGATLVPGGDMTVSGNWANSGTFTNSDYSVTFTASAAISGTNTWKNFTCTTGGVTLTFEAGKTQTVSDAFTIKGSAGSLVSLVSGTTGTQWTIAPTGTTRSVSYAYVKDSYSTYDSIATTNSSSGGHNTNWIFTEKYTWTGTTSTEWALASNWKDSAGNIDTGYPGLSVGDTATIPYITATSNYPILGSALEITSLSIAGSASLTLSSTSNLKLDAASSPLTNAGTISYAGSGRIVNSSNTAINDVSNNGTVAYTGTSGGKITDYGMTDYANLVISGSGAFTQSTASAIVVSGTAEFDATATVSGLASLAVTGAASIGTSITTTGAQTYTGAVTLKGNTVFTANSGTEPAMVTFGSTVKGSASCTVAFGTGTAAANQTNVLFGDAVGGSNYITTLTVYGTATLGSSCTSVATTGAQIYSGAVTLGTNTIFTAGTNLVTFSSTVKGTSSSGQSLTIGASGTATNVSFGGIVGGSWYISTITVYGTTAFGSGCTAVTSTGAQTYTGAVTLGNALVCTAYGTSAQLVKFTGTVSGAYALTVGTSTAKASNAQFGDSTGTDTVGTLASLLVYGTTTFGSSCASVTTTGNQTYTGNATVAAATTTFLANNSGTAGTVTFSGTLKGSSASREITIGSDYTVTTKQTNAVFGGTVGTSGSSNIGKLTVCGTAAINASAVTTTDVQTYYGQVTAGADVTITANGGSAALVTFNGALISSASGRLVKIGSSSVNTNVAFNSTVGSAGKINSLSVYGTTTINCATIINNATIRTTGDQVYSGTVTLSKDAVLVANNSGTANLITFNGNVSGAFALNIGSSTETSNAKFADKITISTASLYVSGTSVLGAASVTTTGIQTYKGKVTLSGSSGTSLSAGSTGVSFGSTVDSDATARALTVSGTTPVKFTGAVGGGSALASLTTGTGAATIDGASVTTTGTQTYGGVIDSTANTLTLTSTTSGGISFANTVLASSTGKTLVLSCASGSVTQTSDAVITAANLLLKGAGTFTLTTATNDFDTIAASVTGVVSLSETDGVAVGSVTDASSTAVAGITSSAAVTLVSTGTVTVSAAVTVTGANLTLSSSAVVNNSSITCGSTLSFTEAGTLSGTGTVSTVNFNFTPTDTSQLVITQSGAITVTGNIVSSSTNTSAGISATAGSFVITPATTTTISGNNTFYTLTASSLGGKEIDFTAGTIQTISSTLTLTGSSTTSLLKLRSSSEGTAWTILCNGTTSLQNLDVEDSTNSSTDYFTATGSTDSGNNIKWNFYGQTYTWVGGATGNTQNWFTKTNWSPASLPGSGAVVSIPSGRSYYPLLTAAVDIGTVAIYSTITIASGATLDCASYSVTARVVDNEGTLRATGISGQKVGSTSNTQTNGTSSLFEYYGNAIAAEVWSGTYQNIQFPAGAAGTISSAITVKGTTVINSGSSYSLTLSGADTFTGLVTITSGNTVTLSGNNTFSGTVTVSGGTTVNLTNGATSAFTLNDDASCGTLAVTGPVALAGEVTTTGTQTYDGAVTLSATSAQTLSANSGSSSVTFKSTVNGAKALKITGSAVFGGVVGGSTALASLSVSGSAAIDGNAVTTTGTQIYSGTVTQTDITTAATITLSSTSTAAGGITFVGTVLSGCTNKTLVINCASGSVTQTSSTAIITASNLLLDGAGTFTLNTASNDIGTVAASSGSGAIFLANSGALTVGTVSSTNGITSTGAVSLTVAGDITVSKPIASSGGTVILTPSSGEINLGYSGGTVLSATSGTTGYDISLNGTAVLSADAVISSSGTSSGGKVAFSSTVDSFDSTARSLTVTADSGDITVGGNAGTSYALGAVKLSGATVTLQNVGASTAGASSLEVTGTNAIALKGTSYYTTGAQTYTGGVTLSGGSAETFTAGSGSSVKFDGKLTGDAQDVSVAVANAEFDGIVTGIVNLSVAGTTAVNTTAVTTSGTQIFSDAVTLGSDTDLKGTAVAFGSTVNSADSTTCALTVAAGSGAVTFTGAVGGSSAVGALVVTGGAVTLYNVGTSSSAGAASLDVTGSSGITMAGTICYTSGTQTYKSAVTLGADQNMIATDSNITFSSTVNSDSTARALTVAAGTGAVTFTGAVGATNKLAALTITSSGALTFSDTLSVTGALTQTNAATGATKFVSTVSVGSADLNGTSYTLTGTFTTTAGGMTVTNSALLLVPEDDDITLYAGSNFAQNGAGLNQLAGGVITSGAGAVSFTSDVYLYGTSGNAMALGGGTGAITSTADLHVAAAGKTVNLNSPVKVKNFVLYTGAVVLDDDADVTASGDVVLLGSGYSIKDGNSASGGVSGVADLFAYINNRRTTKAPSLSVFPTKYPDGITAMPTSYAATLNCPGRTITAQKNFYDNGMALSGCSIKIASNDNETNAFAEAYNCTLTSCTVTPISGTAYLAAAEGCTDGGGNNTNVAFSRPVILKNTIAQARDMTGTANLSGTYTVYDDVVRVEFVDSLTGASIAIENSSNEISAAVANITNSAGSYAAAGSYIDADCTTSTDGQGDRAVFFIKSPALWKTDANGISAGASESTTRSGTASSVVPYIDIPKALATVYATLRDCHKNRIAQYSGTPASSDFDVNYDGTNDSNTATGARFTAVADRASPVLIAARTGQERHTAYSSATGADSQPSYDAHNFIEFQYSEAVNVGNLYAAAGDSNARAETAFASAAAHGGSIETNGSGITVTGIAGISSGAVSAGNRSTGATDTTVSALYRTFATSSSASDSAQTHRIRVSVAGYTDGTISAGGTSFKNWIGYIDSATIPSGSVQSVANAYITDTAYSASAYSANNNPLDDYTASSATTNHKPLAVAVDSTQSVPYGTWDTSAPSFAPYRSAKMTWAEAAPGTVTEYESVGTGATGSSYLNRIEFHVFDNTPTYTSSDEAAWMSRVGWCSGYAAQSKSLYKTYAYAADIFGGAAERVFADASSSSVTGNGGIRYSSVYDSYGAFAYTTDTSGTPDTSFKSQTVTYAAKSPLFNGTGTASRSILSLDPDSPYFGVYLSDTTLPLNTTFKVKYDGTKGYVTDLAGNRLKTATIQTVDRTPPSFSMTLAAAGGNKIYVIFNKALNLGTINWTDNSGADSERDALTSIPQSLELVGLDGSAAPIDIDRSVQPVVYFEGKKATGLIFSLTGTVTLSDMKNICLAVRNTGKATDPLSGLTDVYVSNIQDSVGNFVVTHSAHALTDFALNVVQPQYAYDNRLTDAGTDITYGLYEDGTWAVHNFDADQQNSGTLLTNHNIFISANLYDGTSDNSGGLSANGVPVVYTANSPDSASVAAQYNQTMGASWRTWVPNVTGDVFEPFALANNTAFTTFAGGTMTATATAGFNLPVTTESQYSGWKAGDQVTFLFGLTDSSGNLVMIRHTPVFASEENYDSVSGTEYPFYAFRLLDASDLSSVDLWSFRLKDLKTQRGGVTILNNVINVTNGEHVAVQVDMPSDGNLSVIVMTLDGNVVTYLAHGTTSAGTHYYTWNGRNNSGSTVARGLYFVRVFGNGIDETRKVMVVK